VVVFVDGMDEFALLRTGLFAQFVDELDEEDDDEEDVDEAEEGRDEHSAMLLEPSTKEIGMLLLLFTFINTPLLPSSPLILYMKSLTECCRISAWSITELSMSSSSSKSSLVWWLLPREEEYDPVMNLHSFLFELIRSRGNCC
jgi:hypothetical protein